MPVSKRPVTVVASAITETSRVPFVFSCAIYIKV
jgi:hypothetical protein